MLVGVIRNRARSMDTSAGGWSSCASSTSLGCYRRVEVAFRQLVQWVSRRGAGSFHPRGGCQNMFPEPQCRPAVVYRQAEVQFEYTRLLTRAAWTPSPCSCGGSCLSAGPSPDLLDANRSRSGGMVYSCKRGSGCACRRQLQDAMWEADGLLRTRWDS